MHPRFFTGVKLPLSRHLMLLVVAVGRHVREPLTRAGSARVLGSQADVPADIVMENVAEKLKLLGYEKEFCRRK